MTLAGLNNLQQKGCQISVKLEILKRDQYGSFGASRSSEVAETADVNEATNDSKAR